MIVHVVHGMLWGVAAHAGHCVLHPEGAPCSSVWKTDLTACGSWTGSRQLDGTRRGWVRQADSGTRCAGKPVGCCCVCFSIEQHFLPGSVVPHVLV